MWHRQARAQDGAVSPEFVSVVLVAAALVAALLSLDLSDRVDEVGGVAVDCLFTETCEDVSPGDGSVADSSGVGSGGAATGSSGAGSSTSDAGSVADSSGASGTSAEDGTGVDGGSSGGGDAADPDDQPGPGGEVDPDPLTLDTDDILDEFQVDPDPDGMVTYPADFPFPLDEILPHQDVTAEEAQMLRDLGVLGQKDFKDIRDEAYDESGVRFDYDKGAEDGHQDAMRHAYWNAMMVQRFGLAWAERFGTAHERIAGNPADKEAMDLYNNEVGRRIAVENPDATREELADLVEQAVLDGVTVVIDADGELARSDDVEPGQTGDADDLARDDGQGIELPGDEPDVGGGYDFGDPG